MAHAYTPGLRVTRRATVRKQRRLPLEGTVLKTVGDQVRRDQVVAQTELPGDVTTLNLVNRLGVTPEELPDYMLKKEGEAVAQGEPVAQTRPFIKWFKTTVEAPVSGVVESISPVTGQVMLRQAPKPVEVLAYVDGTVVEVLPGSGVTVETHGAYIQGIFGVGGENWGTLKVVAAAPDQIVDLDRIDDSCAGGIAVVGPLITSAIIDKARQVGAVGLVGGGIVDQDLRQLLGHDLGVAITGTEEIGLTAIVTEGFGHIAMARKTFEILAEFDDKEASISGATQIRAGVLRPEIIVPEPEYPPVDDESPVGGEGGLQVGDLLRVIRMPYFGRVGRVNALPPELQQVESGVRVRVLEVELEDGTKATVPRANVELIEE